MCAEFFYMLEIPHIMSALNGRFLYLYNLMTIKFWVNPLSAYFLVVA